MIKISDEMLKNINGGTYYGNGVSCGKKTCSVNWGQAWNEGVTRWGNSVVSGLTSGRQN